MKALTKMTNCISIA